MWHPVVRLFLNSEKCWRGVAFQKAVNYFYYLCGSVTSEAMNLENNWVHLVWFFFLPFSPFSLCSVEPKLTQFTR